MWAGALTYPRVRGTPYPALLSKWMLTFRHHQRVAFRREN